MGLDLFSIFPCTSWVMGPDLYWRLNNWTRFVLNTAFLFPQVHRPLKTKDSQTDVLNNETRFVLNAALLFMDQQNIVELLKWDSTERSNKTSKKLTKCNLRRGFFLCKQNLKLYVSKTKLEILCKQDETLYKQNKTWNFMQARQNLKLYVSKIKLENFM